MEANRTRNIDQKGSAIRLTNNLIKKGYLEKKKDKAGYSDNVCYWRVNVGKLQESLKDKGKWQTKYMNWSFRRKRNERGQFLK